MASTILVIDSNAAVQAITALALSETGCAIEQLTEGAHALERIAKLRPTVVLIAKELTGVDPLQVPERMRSASPDTCYVLLAPADGSTALESRATQAGFSEVLFKPFKSNRLREVVTRLLTQAVAELPAAAPERPRIYLNIRDKFLISLFQRLFSRTEAEIFFEQSGEVERPFTVTVSQFQEGTSNDVNLGRQLIICSELESDAARIAHPHCEILALPFGTRELSKAVAGLLSFSAPEQPHAAQQVPSPDSGEQALLAARISAAIFEQLLLQPALKEGDWEGAASLASAATLRIAHERQKL